LSQDFRGKGRPWGTFFSFYKTRHILVSDSANCTVLRTCRRLDTIPAHAWQTDRQTDTQTNANAIASTALAMRALRRAVKTDSLTYAY